MRTLIIWILTLTLFTGLGALYGGLGWVVAWILEKGLNIDINYIVFVVAGVGIFLLKAILMLLVRLYAKKKIDDFDKEFDRKRRF